MQALEGAEQLGGESHVESRAVVPDIKDGVAVSIRLAANLDARQRLPGREFPGIVQQVLKEERQQADVALRAQAILDLKLRLAPRLPLPVVVSEAPGDFRKIDML